MQLLQASTFLASVLLFIVPFFYLTIPAAPDIAEALANTPNLDGVRSGLYRNIYIVTTGLFTISLYSSLVQHTRLNSV